MLDPFLAFCCVAAFGLGWLLGRLRRRPREFELRIANHLADEVKVEVDASRHGVFLVDVGPRPAEEACADDFTGYRADGDYSVYEGEE